MTASGEKIFWVDDILESKPGLILAGINHEWVPIPSKEELRVKAGPQVELRLPDGQSIVVQVLGIERKLGCFSPRANYFMLVDPASIPEGLKITQGTEVWSLPNAQT